MVQKTIFPFDLIPTIVEVTEEDIILTYRQLLGTSQREVIPLKEVHTVEVDSDIFFSTLVVAYGIPERQLKIGKFWKKDANTLELEIQHMMDKLDRGGV